MIIRVQEQKQTIGVAVSGNMIQLTNILNEDLRKWFGKGGEGSTTGGGWDRYNSKGEKAGKCGDSEKGDSYAACLSKEKAAKLGKDGIAAFVKRKRAAQSKAGDSKKGGEQSKGQKPTFVKTGASEGLEEKWSAKYKKSINCSNPKGFSQKAHCAGKKKNESMTIEEKMELFLEKNVPTDPAKWAASKAAAKSKFDVYPSAYANGWAAKNYKAKGGGWKVAKEGVQNNIDEAIHPEVFREFMQACNDAGLNSFQIFGMHVLVYILTLGATGLTILSALGIAQLAKDAKDTFNNWNAGRKLNPEKVKAIVKDFENKVNKLEGGRKKFFQGIINKMKRTNPENKSALVSINRDLEHYAQAYGIKDESVIKEVEVGQGHENDRDMVVGVAEILRMVGDMNNRKEIADSMLRKFKSEDVIHNAKEFLTLCGIS